MSVAQLTGYGNLNGSLSTLYLSSTGSAALTVNGGVSVVAGITAGGDITTGGAVLTTGAATFLGGLTVEGTADLSGASSTLIGDATISGDVEFTGGTCAINSDTVTIQNPPLMPAAVTVFNNGSSEAPQLPAQVALSTGGTPAPWPFVYLATSGDIAYLTFPDLSGLTIDMTEAPGVLVASAPSAWASASGAPGVTPDTGLIPPMYRPPFTVSFMMPVTDGGLSYFGLVTVRGLNEVIGTQGNVEFSTARGSSASAPNFTAAPVNVTPTVLTWFIADLPSAVAAPPAAPPAAKASAPAARPKPAARAPPAAANIAAALAAVPSEDLTASKMAIVEARVVAHLAGAKK